MVKPLLPLSPGVLAITLALPVLATACGGGETTVIFRLRDIEGIQVTRLDITVAGADGMGVPGLPDRALTQQDSLWVDCEPDPENNTRGRCFLQVENPFRGGNEYALRLKPTSEGADPADLSIAASVQGPSVLLGYGAQTVDTSGQPIRLGTSGEVELTICPGVDGACDGANQPPSSAAAAAQPLGLAP
ncbi:MAG: hypothetical protein GMKNLPBB_00048 [Myxococcota bacterium]|nr:hypothetical protein [Myxococcota bacterium]